VAVSDLSTNGHKPTDLTNQNCGLKGCIFKYNESSMSNQIKWNIIPWTQLYYLIEKRKLSFYTLFQKR